MFEKTEYSGNSKPKLYREKEFEYIIDSQSLAKYLAKPKNLQKLCNALLKLKKQDVTSKLEPAKL